MEAYTQQPLVFEQFDASNEEHLKAALLLETWRKDEDAQMLVLGPEVMSGHLMGVMCFLDGPGDRELVGYNAALIKYPNGLIEIGGMFVNPDFRGKGVATAIKAEILKLMGAQFPENSLITFCNPSSERLNRSFGFRDASLDEVPVEAYELCTNCNRQAQAQAIGQVCCDSDRILIYDCS